MTHRGGEEWVRQRQHVGVGRDASTNVSCDSGVSVWSACVVMMYVGACETCSCSRRCGQSVSYVAFENLELHRLLDNGYLATLARRMRSDYVITLDHRCTLEL